MVDEKKSESSNRRKFIVEIDPEFMEILDKLEQKVRHATWDGVDRLSKKTLTRILARKIKNAKIL